MIALALARDVDAAWADVWNLAVEMPDRSDSAALLADGVRAREAGERGSAITLQERFREHGDRGVLIYRWRRAA